LYTIRSERQLVEHIQYNMLYRWFVRLELDDMVWDHSTFSKNWERLLDHQVMPALFESVLKLARKRQLLSAEHFSVDGTLIQAWASHKSFRSKDDDDNSGSSGRERDFRGQRRSNDTHASTTDPETELMRKSAGQEARLSYGVGRLMENRNTLVVRVVTRRAATVHERSAGLAMVKAESGGQRITVGGDCGYDTAAFIEGCREHM
jgi:hypothetical protein